MASPLQCLLVIFGISYNFSLEMHSRGSDNFITAETSWNKKKPIFSKKKRRASESATSVLEIFGQEGGPRLVRGIFRPQLSSVFFL